MPDHTLRFRLCVVASFLSPRREDNISGEDDRKTAPREAQSNGNVQIEEKFIMGRNEKVCDRQNFLVINEDAEMGESVFSASKKQSIISLGQHQVTEIAVREHGTAKFSEILRYMHVGPCSVSTEREI